MLHSTSNGMLSLRMSVNLQRNEKKKKFHQAKITPISWLFFSFVEHNILITEHFGI